MHEDVAVYLAKAAESLLTAESEFVNRRYNSCANRCYYACFQAAVAALIQEGIRPREKWGHAFVQGQFVGQLIDRRKRFSGDLRSVLADNQNVRDQADYQEKSVTQTQARRALGRARTFVNAVRQRSEAAS
jgi:uncharacterized protein (UPF0332 family)